MEMTVELVEEDCGAEVYGIVERGFVGDVVHYEGSKVEVLCFYLGMVGQSGEA